MSSSPASIRLLSDLKQMRTNPPEGTSAAPVSEDDLHTWEATIFGPPETPWEGGIFPLTLKFPNNYPERPPKVYFKCEVFHPNVYADGTLCLDIIQEKWTPIYSVSSILTSIQSLLADPNCSSPANAEASALYSSDRKQYNRRVRRMVERSLEL
eukprot:gb/GECH01006867.1/.p1 GENE.gb/GECH01006867.1/~~gb/GECH01006867.1/.p1  ORF type:complete len:154 (+),score=11.80 gb/GECH01006867.1/:1-462(+)